MVVSAGVVTFPMARPVLFKSIGGGRRRLPFAVSFLIPRGTTEVTPRRTLTVLISDSAKERWRSRVYWYISLL